MNKLIPAAVAVLAVAGGSYFLSRAPEGASNPTAAKEPAEGDPIVSISIPGSLSDQAKMARRWCTRSTSHRTMPIWPS